MGDTTRLYIVDGHNNFASPSSGDSGNDACASDAPALPMNRVTRVRVVMNATRVAVYYNDTLVCTEPRNDRSIFMGASVPLHVVSCTAGEDAHLGTPITTLRNSVGILSSLRAAMKRVQSTF
eukprot:m.512805 g.512805  ORF g.512805 m.512805 type:complete len:122 (-) comp21897_c1_seq21:1382-1747(-)